MRGFYKFRLETIKCAEKQFEEYCVPKLFIYMFYTSEIQYF